jgi:hypothetical protein
MNSNGVLNCLLITHNNILQCFIEKQRVILDIQNDERKIRFKNCAILCLTLNLTSYNFTIELVYDGQLSDEENRKVSPQRPYYVTLATPIVKGNEALYVPFETIQGQISNETRALNLLPIDLDQLKDKFKTDTIKFYIVRHGQAEHNEKKWDMAGFSLKLDTTITQEGKSQADNSAEALKNILGNETIDIVCASDLQRTRQTALPFISQFHILSLSNFLPKIVIVPCANELNKSGKNGNCYEKSSNSSIFASKSSRENYPACEPQTCPSIRLQKDVDVDIDWSIYSLFYDNKMRSYPNLTDKPNCKDTNMVSMTVFYLLNYEEDRLEHQKKSIIEVYDEDDANKVWKIFSGGSKKQKRKIKLSRKNKLVKNRVTKKRRKRQNI